jgi:hypothetical protein
MGERVLGPSESKRRRLWRYRFFILPVVAITAAAFLITSASAVHDEGLFELDKNLVDNTPAVPPDEDSVLPDDWENIAAVPQTDHAFNDTGIVADRAPNSIFTGGGSKDDHDIPDWKYKNGSVPDKDDITNAYAAGYTNSDDDIIVYFGMDRFATQGSANVGFWFFQDDVAPVSGGTTFGPGAHEVGDVLVLSEFDEGGTGVTIKVFEWVGTGGDEGGGTLQTLFGGETGDPADCVGPGGVPAGDDVCATVNTSTINNGGTPDGIPWNYDGKGGTTNMAPGVFFEGGINLTDMFEDTPGGTPCISNFLAETRSSFEVNAVLKDFVHSSFPLCGEKSGVKFHDLNADGVHDADGADDEEGTADDEEGLDGWTINLYQDNGDGVLEDADDGTTGDGVNAFDTDTTDADGAYSFEQLAFGPYIICEELKENWKQSAPSTSVPVPDDEELVDTCPGPDSTTTNGYAFTMSGPSLEDNDFGNFQEATISGTKFKDVNDDGGPRDANGVDNIAGNADDEIGLSEWQIRVYSGSTQVSGSPLTTNGSGAYSINLNPGTYKVCEVIDSPALGEPVAHPGWVQSYPVGGATPTTGSTTCNGQGEAPRGWSVNVTSGGTTNLRDFGNSPLSKINVDFLPQAKLPGPAGGADDGADATGATSISCTPGGSNTGSNTFTSPNGFRISDGALPPSGNRTITCTITYEDP